jgi:hypothetical protein
MGRDDETAGVAAGEAAKQGRTVFAWVARENVSGKSKELVSLGTQIEAIETAGWKLERFEPRWTALDGAHRTTLLFRRA